MAVEMQERQYKTLKSKKYARAIKLVAAITAHTLHSVYFGYIFRYTTRKELSFDFVTYPRFHRGTRCFDLHFGRLFSFLSGKSLSNRGNSNPVVLSGLSLANKKIGNYSFAARVGRYVNIRLVGENKRLVLCEVEVFGVYSGDVLSILYKALQLYCKAMSTFSR